MFATYTKLTSSANYRHLHRKARTSRSLMITKQMLMWMRISTVTFSKWPKRPNILLFLRLPYKISCEYTSICKCVTLDNRTEMHACFVCPNPVIHKSMSFDGAIFGISIDHSESANTKKLTLNLPYATRFGRRYTY